MCCHTILSSPTTEVGSLSLPHPSAIFVSDSLNKHNVKAMVKNANRSPSEEAALATALALEAFHKYLGDAIKDMEAS